MLCQATCISRSTAAVRGKGLLEISVNDAIMNILAASVYGEPDPRLTDQTDSWRNCQGEAAMNAICKFVNTYLTADDVVLALVLVGIFAFSILAARAQTRLWKKTQHITCRWRQQQFITEARGHLR